jgi:hypothetical protein
LVVRVRAVVAAVFALVLRLFLDLGLVAALLRRALVLRFRLGFFADAIVLLPVVEFGKGVKRAT